MTQRRVIRKQPNSRMCLVCGLRNAAGLKASFYELDNGEVLCLINSLAEHQGYPGRLHGGIAAALLDETIGRAILAGREKIVWGVTIQFTIKYRRPLPLDDELKVVGRITRETRRRFEGTGEILLSSGEIAATGAGTYLKMPLGQIADFDVTEQEWRVTLADHDPEIAEV
jgi:acyl-coenzyme A thioesterase PaaI-like protein